MNPFRAPRRPAAAPSSTRRPLASLWRKTWRDVRVMTLVYTLILELGLIGAILLWPQVRPEAAAIGRIIPADFIKRMADALSSPSEEAAFNAYMAVQMFFKGTNVVAVAFAVLLGTGIIARERETHTLEFLLSRPVSRSRVLWTKFTVIATALVVPIFLTSASAVPLSLIEDETLHLERVLAASVHAAAFGLLFFAGTTLVSVLARSQVQVAFVVGAFIIIQVIVYFVQVIRRWSVFRLADFDVFGPLMMGQEGFAAMFFGTTIWLLAATVILGTAADIAFRRIDL